jgi:hypothetical protein
MLQPFGQKVEAPRTVVSMAAMLACSLGLKQPRIGFVSFWGHARNDQPETS